MLNDKREIFTDKKELYRITYINKNSNLFGKGPNKLK